MPDDGIQQVLEAVKSLSAELVEIRKDVKLAVAHGGDIKQLNQDVARIEKRLEKIDAFINGDPPLEARLKRLEVKQEKDRKTAAHETSEAGVKQEGVNVGFREKFAQLFGITGELQQASLRLFGIISLSGAVIIYILARALGA